MMHDFSLTDKYVVIYDLPVTFDPVQVLPANDAALAGPAGPAGAAVADRARPGAEPDQRR